MRVHFRLVDAAEGEHGNVKPSKARIASSFWRSVNYIAEEDGELSPTI